MFKLAERSIQRVNNSYYVNVPITWIRNWKLHKNATVLLTLGEKGELIVQPMTEENKDES